MLKKGSVLNTAFNEYIIKEQIGQGGSGTVFLIASSDGESFAVKIINKKVTSKDKIKRFKNELYFCLKHNHTNIIQVVDYGIYTNDKLDCLFYVMPYYNNTLRKEIESGIEPKRVIQIFTQLLSGIEFAHKNGVWHRDLKPENILYDKNKQIAIIADFGIAHFCADDIITAVETKAVERLANFIYAAPEQRRKGQAVDGRADVFAIGLILNEMFTKTVISGSNYKKIIDCNKEYGFLDQVVDELISQDPINRLFPVSKILIEISAHINLESDKVELNAIIEKKINEDYEEDQLFVAPEVVDIQYENEQLVLYLDKKTNPFWDSILISGQYSHSSLFNYPTKLFHSRDDKERNCTAFYVKVQYNDERLIEDVIRQFKTWLPVVSSTYTQKEKEKRANIIRQEKEKREQEIKAKQTEMRIKEKLKSLI